MAGLYTYVFTNGKNSVTISSTLGMCREAVDDFVPELINDGLAYPPDDELDCVVKHPETLHESLVAIPCRHVLQGDGQFQTW